MRQFPGRKRHRWRSVWASCVECSESFINSGFHHPPPLPQTNFSGLGLCLRALTKVQFCVYPLPAFLSESRVCASPLCRASSHNQRGLVIPRSVHSSCAAHSTRFTHTHPENAGAALLMKPNCTEKGFQCDQVSPKSRRALLIYRTTLSRSFILFLL